MVQVTQHSSLRLWCEKLAYLHDEWMSKGDEENAKKSATAVAKSGE